MNKPAKRILIIKTSSLGDVIHTLPALTDARAAIPGISFDWVVEEGFQEIPKLHPLVDRVIPVAIRRWRKTPLRALFSKEIRTFWHNLRAQHYDAIIDAQGLLKSALLTRMARGLRVGLDKASLTEPLARFFYQRTVSVDLSLHAVFRMRSIFAKALGYDLLDTAPDYGLDAACFKDTDWTGKPYVVFVHGTSWATKHWPDTYWLTLAKLITVNGFAVRIPFSNETEQKRAQALASTCKDVYVIPKTHLTGMAQVLAGAKGVVAVDTGLGHLAAALHKPTVSLYGPTKPDRTGTAGLNQIHLVSDCRCIACCRKTCRHQPTNGACLENITPESVWKALQEVCL